MALYTITPEDMDRLIELSVADEPVEHENTEITFVEIFRFTRKDNNEWIGPYHQRPLLEEILANHEIEFTLIDCEEEAKEMENTDHLDNDALEEELRSEQSIMTRLNQGKIEE